MTIGTYTVVPANPWPLPTLRAHPRIFLTPARLARLQSLYNNPSADFTALKATYPGGGSTNDGPHIMACLINYLATGSVANLNLAYNNAINGGGGGGAITLYADTAPYVFDWGYNDLTSAQKTALISLIESRNASFEAAAPNGPLPGCGQEQGYGAYAMGVLAIEGEAGATSRLATLRNMVQNVSAWIDEGMGDGHWVGYPHETPNFCIASFLNFHIAGGIENLAAGRFKFLSNRTKLLSYRTTSGGWNMLSGPSDHKAMGSASNVAPRQDGTQDTAKAEMACHYAVYADVMGDGLAQTMMNAVVSQSASNKWTTGWDVMNAYPAWLAFMFYNSTIAPVAQSTLPNSAIFPLPGQVAFRTGWSNPATTVRGWLYSPNYQYLCHDSHYAGCLEITRGDDQLICNPYTYAGQPCAWQTKVGLISLSKSTLLFSPTGSATPDRSGAQTDSAMAPPGSSAAFPIATQFAGTQATWLSGTVGNFACNAGYAQATADYGNAYYPNATVTSAKRLVALLNGADEAHGTFLVRDCFATVAGAVDRIRALWGCRQKPVGMTNETIVAGDTTAGVLTYPNQPVVIQWRNSQAIIQMISPAPVTLRLVGGVGYESYFDGANLDYWANSQSGKTVNQYARIQGMWRLECETTPAAANGEMLFAITVGDIGSVAPNYTLPQAWAAAPQLFGILPIDGVTLMPNSVTVSVPKKFKANFTTGGVAIVPAAQVAFTSADPTKVTVAPVAGTFDQFLATPLGANADGSPATVGVHCVLSGSPTYSAFAGDPTIAVNSQLVDTLTLTVVP